MIIFSSCHNAESYIKKHLESIQAQSYKDYTHIIVDDASTDNTFKIIKQYKDSRTKICRNEKILRVAQSWILHLKPITLKYPDEIIIWVGGDDWLSNNKVFKKIADIYKNKNCWMTYGSFYYLSNPKIKLPQIKATKKMLESRTFRDFKHPWIYQPLQTFKAFLFNNVRESDFHGPKGEWIPSSNDRALIYALLEMCPADKIQYIEDLLYVYNDENPECVHNSGRQKEQVFYDFLARSRKPYKILEKIK